MKIYIIILIQIVLPFHSIHAEDMTKYAVKWGLILPLSGVVARSGLDLQRGYELALEDLSQGNVKHQVIIEDSGSQARTAVGAAQKLINIDHVDILVSVWDTAEAIAPFAEKHNLLHASIRWNSDITEQFLNTFTFESTYKTYVKKFLELFQKQGFKRLSILGQESTGWNLAEAQFLQGVSAYGITVVSKERYSDQADFSLLALKAVKAKPDIILINDITEPVELLAKKIKVLNPQQKITGYLGYPLNYALFEGAYYVNQLKLDPGFSDRFQKKYHQPVYTRAQLAYDQMNIIASVYRKFSQKPSTATVVKELQQIKSYQGMSGVITNSQGKVFETECEIRKIEDGKDIPAA